MIILLLLRSRGDKNVNKSRWSSSLGSYTTRCLPNASSAVRDGRFRKISKVGKKKTRNTSFCQNIWKHYKKCPSSYMPRIIQNIGKKGQKREHEWTVRTSGGNGNGFRVCCERVSLKSLVPSETSGPFQEECVDRTNVDLI